MGLDNLDIYNLNLFQIYIILIYELSSYIFIPVTPSGYTGPIQSVWESSQCPELQEVTGGTLNDCFTLCDRNTNCNGLLFKFIDTTK